MSILCSIVLQTKNFDFTLEYKVKCKLWAPIVIPNAYLIRTRMKYSGYWIFHNVQEPSENYAFGRFVKKIDTFLHLFWYRLFGNRVLSAQRKEHPNQPAWNLFNIFWFLISWLTYILKSLRNVIKLLRVVTLRGTALRKNVEFG